MPMRLKQYNNDSTNTTRKSIIGRLPIQAEAFRSIPFQAPSPSRCSPPNICFMFPSSTSSRAGQGPRWRPTSQPSSEWREVADTTVIYNFSVRALHIYMHQMLICYPVM